MSKLPDQLERRAIKIDAAIVRLTKGKTEWNEGIIDLVFELVGAKIEFPANQDFGQWFEDRFPSVRNTIKKNERATLIRWGASTAEEIRAVLEQEESTSIQGIANRHPNLGKPARAYSKPVTPPPPPPPPASLGGPKFRPAKDFAQAHKDTTGQLPSSVKIARATGVSVDVAQDVLRSLQHGNTQVTYTKAQDKEVEARIKVLEAQFNERVRLAMLERNKEFIVVLEQSKKDASEKAYHYSQNVDKQP